MIFLLISNVLLIIALVWAMHEHQKDYRTWMDHLAMQNHQRPSFTIEDRPGSRVHYVDESREVELQDTKPGKVTYAE